MYSTTTLTSLYGAILDDSMWQSALDALAFELGAKSAQLIYCETQDKHPFHVKLCSQLLAQAPPDIIARYERELGHYEEDIWDVLQNSVAGTTVSDADFHPADVLRARPDYLYLIENFGVCHRLGLRLNGNRAWTDCLTFLFDDSVLVAPESSRLMLPGLWPHVAKATECSRLFRTLRTRYQAALAALDHVSIGICVVNSRAEVIIKNRTADEIFSDNPSVLCRHDSVLFCNDKNERFVEAVRRCSMTAAGNHVTTEVLLAADDPVLGSRLLIEISPLHDQAGEVDKGLSGALISLIDPMKTEALDSSKVALGWELTDAEAGVLRLLILGDSYGDMADKRGVSIETVRTQVKCVYAKTATRNRGDLIRLVAKTSPPIH